MSYFSSVIKGYNLRTTETIQKCFQFQLGLKLYISVTEKLYTVIEILRKYVKNSVLYI